MANGKQYRGLKLKNELKNSTELRQVRQGKWGADMTCKECKYHSYVNSTHFCDSRNHKRKTVRIDAKEVLKDIDCKWAERSEVRGMKVVKYEHSYLVTECDLTFGEQITLDGELLIPVSILDKIRAEIQETIGEERTGNGNINKGVVIGLQMALDTIDKYKAASNVQDLDGGAAE